jgi:hypothetical protein
VFTGGKRGTGTEREKGKEKKERLQKTVLRLHLWSERF